jgi:hypothetical protein
MRRRVRPRVLRVSTAMSNTPPMIHGIAMKQKKRMGDGQRDPEGHQAKDAKEGQCTMQQSTKTN